MLASIVCKLMGTLAHRHKGKCTNNLPCAWFFPGCGTDASLRLQAQCCADSVGRSCQLHFHDCFLWFQWGSFTHCKMKLNFVTQTRSRSQRHNAKRSALGAKFECLPRVSHLLRRCACETGSRVQTYDLMLMQSMAQMEVNSFMDECTVVCCEFDIISL